jgi:hypothetical protein
VKNWFKLYWIPSAPSFLQIPYRCLSLLYRVSRFGTKAAVALWYNTARCQPWRTATSLTRGIPLMNVVSSIEVVTNQPTQPSLPKFKLGGWRGWRGALIIICRFNFATISSLLTVSNIKHQWTYHLIPNWLFVWWIGNVCPCDDLARFTPSSSLVQRSVGL